MKSGERNRNDLFFLVLVDVEGAQVGTKQVRKACEIGRKAVEVSRYGALLRLLEMRKEAKRIITK